MRPLDAGLVAAPNVASGRGEGRVRLLNVKDFRVQGTRPTTDARDGIELREKHGWS